LSSSEGLTLAETVGEYVRKDDKGPKSQHGQPGTQLTINLGNLQYGQSRDILLKYGSPNQTDSVAPIVQATLTYEPVDGSPESISKSRDVLDITTLPHELVFYHRARSTICSFLSSLAPLSNIDEHISIDQSKLDSKRKELEIIIAQLNVTEPQDELTQSLLQDLCGPDPSGQIRLSLSTDEIFTRWGAHFLLSLLNAHEKQYCNSFKDPGPLQYGKDSPLFIKCRNLLDQAFDNLPAPKPSVAVRDSNGNVKKVRISMSQYHNRNGPCFAAGCVVKSANGAEVEVAAVKKGVELWTPRGARKVAAVVATAVQDHEMCKVGALVVTPWHPISLNGRWMFPNDAADSKMRYTGTIYSLMMEPDQDVEAHGVEVSGCLAVTLGHGKTDANDETDARSHPFLGDYVKVAASLSSLSATSEGVFSSKGMKRSEKTGLVCGFHNDASA
jgi:Hint-domain/VWA / Hh  protein intein-like